MTDQLNPANNIAEAILSELDHFQQHFHPAGGALTGPGQYHLLNEPCVGYAAAQRPNGSKVEIFICRNYVPFDYKPARHSIDYASYLSKAGRIMAKKPGEVHAFAVTDRLGFTLEQYAFELTAKDEFRPRKDGSHWDATDRDIAETLDKIADITPSAIYNYVGRWQRAASGLTTEEIDTAVFPNIPPLIAKLKKEVKDLVEGLSLARLFLLIPRAYHEFREVPANQTRFFELDSEKALRDRQLSEPEQDVLLYQALEFTRTMRGQLPGDQTGVPDELRSLLTRFRLLVTVDEATDFSPLETRLHGAVRTPGGWCHHLR